MPLPEFKDGDLAEYNGSRDGMTHGKTYKLYVAGDIYVILRNDRDQWDMIYENDFYPPAKVTDLGAAEYEEIMMSIGEV